MKLIVELTSKRMIAKYKKLSNISYFIVACESLSFNSNHKFIYEELIAIYNQCRNLNIKLILNAEKLFSDKDFVLVKELIDKNFFELFEYVTYSDFGFKNFLETEGVKIKFILKASTYLTNYLDVNEYNNINDYVVASSEISSEELIELSNHVNKNIIVDLFGMSACFYSRRELLTNYFKYRMMDNNPKKDNYYIIEELRNDLLPIVEDQNGTIILEPKFHLLSDELINLKNIDFGIISTRKLNQKLSYVVVEAFNEFINNLDVDLLISKLDDALVPYYKGAYNIKSILLKGGNSCE